MASKMRRLAEPRMDRPRDRANSKRSYVVSTYSSLTTCGTYDARNHSWPDVACRPHSYTLRNRTSDVRVTCVDATPSPHSIARVALNMATNRICDQEATATVNYSRAKLNDPARPWWTAEHTRAAVAMCFSIRVMKNKYRGRELAISQGGMAYVGTDHEI
ncbi:hypothetical protein Bbelb_094410 [Branchiostoma belcheri]|nr:hypothetical protein Bbelb_094410 [Branchiostoma belcheri]